MSKLQKQILRAMVVTVLLIVAWAWHMSEMQVQRHRQQELHAKLRKSHRQLREVVCDGLDGFACLSVMDAFHSKGFQHAKQHRDELLTRSGEQ